MCVERCCSPSRSQSAGNVATRCASPTDRMCWAILQPNWVAGNGYCCNPDPACIACAGLNCSPARIESRAQGSCPAPRCGSQRAVLQPASRRVRGAVFQPHAAEVNGQCCSPHRGACAGQLSSPTLRKSTGSAAARIAARAWGNFPAPRCGSQRAVLQPAPCHNPRYCNLISPTQFRAGSPVDRIKSRLLRGCQDSATAVHLTNRQPL